MPDDGFKPTWPAALYASARPSYPPELISAMLQQAASTTTTSGHGLNVVDLGAGTGICTRMLIDVAIEKGIALQSITALDASPNMLAELDRTLFTSANGDEAHVPSLQRQGKLPANVKTHCAEGKFETMDVQSAGVEGKVDLLVIAQAFHWCADYNVAFEKFQRALRPGGVVALIWNLEDRDAAQWVGKVRDLYEIYESGSPQYRLGLWRKMYETIAFKENFVEVQPRHVTRGIPTTVEGVCQRINSKSYVSVQSKEKQEKLHDDVVALLSQNDDAKLQRTWIDKSKGIFEYPYRTDLFMFQKK